jgi:hypothetical protein
MSSLSSKPVAEEGGGEGVLRPALQAVTAGDGRTEGLVGGGGLSLPEEDSLRLRFEGSEGVVAPIGPIILFLATGRHCKTSCRPSAGALTSPRLFKKAISPSSPPFHSRVAGL